MNRIVEFSVKVPDQIITTTDNEPPDEESISTWLGEKIMDGTIKITITELKDNNHG